MQPEPTMELSRSQKKARRYLLIYIAGMGLVPFFGIDISAISASILQLLIAFILLTSKTLQLEPRQFLLQHKFLFVIFLLWLLLAIKAGLQSPILETAQGLEAIISWTRLLCYLSFFILGFSMYLFFRQVPLEQKLLVKAMSYIMLAIILNMLLVYQLYPDLRISFSWANTPPGYSNIRHAGYHVCIISIFLLFLLQKLVSWKEQVLFTTLLIGFWAFNFWMGGRGSVVAAMLGSFIFIALLYWKAQAWKHVLLSLLVAIIIGLILSEFFVVFDWNGFFSAVQKTAGAPNAERLSAGRTNQWLHAIELIKEGYMSGFGTGVYRFSDAHAPLSQPHNFILQFTFDWGVFGALCMLFLLVYFFIAGFKRHAHADSNINVFSLCCGAVVLALLALGMIDGTLYHTQPTFYFMFAMVLWLVATPELAK